MYPQSPSKWQLSEQERRGEITPAEYYRALQERSDALNFAAKRKPGGKKKESGSKDDPKCSADNYQCRGSKGVACISKKKGCRADLDKQVVSPERKQYIDETIEKLKEAGKSPPKVRIGRKLGAPITDISWEQYAKALELNVSGRKLSVGDATREQLKAIGVDVDGLTAKPVNTPKTSNMDRNYYGADGQPMRPMVDRNRSDLTAKTVRDMVEAFKAGSPVQPMSKKDIDRIFPNGLGIDNRPVTLIKLGNNKYAVTGHSRVPGGYIPALKRTDGSTGRTSLKEAIDEYADKEAGTGRMFTDYRGPFGVDAQTVARRRKLTNDEIRLDEVAATLDRLSPSSLKYEINRREFDRLLEKTGQSPNLTPHDVRTNLSLATEPMLDAAPEPTPPQAKLQKAAAEKAARSVEDMATQMSDALRNGSALPETVKAIANDPDTDPDRRAAARQALESQGSQAPKPETRKALELNGFKFAGSLYKGQELSDGIDRLADKIEREALEIRSGAPYASHVTEATKDEILAQDMKRAQALRDGLITDFTTMQRLAFEISGEDVPLLG